MGIGKGRLQNDSLLLPFIPLHFHRLFQRIGTILTHQFHRQFHRSCVRSAGIDRKTIFLTFLQTDTGKSLIIESGPEQTSVIHHTHIVRIPFKARLLTLHTHISKRHPTYKWLRKFKRTVLHQFGIQTSVGTKIDIFKEDAIHGRLYLGCRFRNVNSHDMLLRLQANSQ